MIKQSAGKNAAALVNNNIGNQFNLDKEILRSCRLIFADAT